MDGEQAYRNLSAYRVTVALEVDGWHIDYEFTDPQMAGGGPHYVIESATGQIVSKHYEQ